MHSDLCRRMNEKSLSGAEYFLSFIDNKTRCVWVYFLKSKDQVFEKFLEWKAMVEKSTRRKLKAICTDNGGEFTSRELEAHMTAEGVCHELVFPKNPEQNGVAERMKLPDRCLSMQTCHTVFELKPCPLLLTCETEALPR